MKLYIVRWGFIPSFPTKGQPVMSLFKLTKESGIIIEFLFLFLLEKTKRQNDLLMNVDDLCHWNGGQQCG